MGSRKETDKRVWKNKERGEKNQLYNTDMPSLYPQLSIPSKVYTHTQTHSSSIDIFPNALLCWISLDFRLASPFLSFHITCVRGALWIFLLSRALSIWPDSKRAKCKALHPLLNNTATWEAFVRHLHFTAPVIPPWQAPKTPKLAAGEGSYWQVCATCSVMQMGFCI